MSRREPGQPVVLGSLLEPDHQTGCLCHRRATVQQQYTHSIRNSQSKYMCPVGKRQATGTIVPANQHIFWPALAAPSAAVGTPAFPLNTMTPMKYNILHNIQCTEAASCIQHNTSRMKRLSILWQASYADGSHTCWWCWQCKGSPRGCPCCWHSIVLLRGLHR